MTPAPFDRTGLEAALTMRARGQSLDQIEHATGIHRQTARFHHHLRTRAPVPDAPDPLKTLTPLQRHLAPALEAASAYFGSAIVTGDVVTNQRDRNTTALRYWVMAWMRWKHGLDLSLPQLGRTFRCHHTTVLRAERLAPIMFPDAVFARKIDGAAEIRLGTVGLSFQQTQRQEVAYG